MSDETNMPPSARVLSLYGDAATNASERTYTVDEMFLRLWGRTVSEQLAAFEALEVSRERAMRATRQVLFPREEDDMSDTARVSRYVWRLIHHFTGHREQTYHVLGGVVCLPCRLVLRETREARWMEDL